MREYEDPQHHFDRHMDQAATRYVEGLQRAGLTPNARPTRAVSERALREARDSYTRAVNDTYEHNLNTILSDHHQRMNQIKREGMRLRWKTCPLIALLFGFLAWYNGSQSHDVLMAMVCAATSLAFLLMLILGAIFDRPR